MVLCLFQREEAAAAVVFDCLARGGIARNLLGQSVARIAMYGSGWQVTLAS